MSRRAWEEADRAAARERVLALAGIEDLSLRRSALLFRLAAMTPEAGAAFLNGLVALAEDRHPAATSVVSLLADPQHVTATLGPRRMAALVTAARDGGRHGAVRLLAGDAARLNSDGPEAQPERTSMDHVPLGRRKQLGRTGSRDVLDRLLYDQQPSVIENLLVNPRITEREVVRIAAHRPTSAAILAVVFRHPRWLARYHVKRALALNPYTPPAQAISLLPSLFTQDLEQIAGDATLHEGVAAAARRLLAGRPGGADAERAGSPGRSGAAPDDAGTGTAAGAHEGPVPEAAGADSGDTGGEDREDHEARGRN